MENMSKTDFINLLQDEVFVQLVTESDNPEELMDELVSADPENGDAIRHAIQFILANHLEKRKMDVADFDRILSNIQAYAKTKRVAKQRRIVLPGIWKAAVVFIIISSASFLVYYQYGRDPLRQFAQSKVSDSGQAVIVLSDGSERLINSNDSYIEYDPSGGEVVVKNENVEEKRIENSDGAKKSALNQVVVPYGQRQSVYLSDGTFVQLNAGSKLVFPATFSGRTREVYLQGEGFFEVKKNEKAPFIVKTDFIDVKVLGTTFNVSAYGDEDFATAVLVEGKVNVSQKDKLFSNEEFQLLPGQGCFYSIGSQNSVVKDVDVNQYVAWKDGLFYFKDMRLVDLVRRVKKIYNVSVQIKGEQLANIMVSGKLVLSNNFNEVAEYLAKTVEGRCSGTQEGKYILEN
jgi:ferric-dicitrate binding protein FerR (iron transport regulator)